MWCLKLVLSQDCLWRFIKLIMSRSGGEQSGFWAGPWMATWESRDRRLILFSLGSGGGVPMRAKACIELAFSTKRGSTRTSYNFPRRGAKRRKCWGSTSVGKHEKWSQILDYENKTPKVSCSLIVKYFICSLLFFHSIFHCIRKPFKHI